MADLFASGKFTATTDAGAPLAGGKLFSYAAGTLTPLATFTTQAGNIANANPAILDSAGRANVWLGPLAYRLILKTAADVTLWDTDNVQGSVTAADLSASTGSSLVGHIASGTGAVARTVQAKLRDAFNVKDFGATGDGVTNDGPAIVACLLAAKTLGRLCVFFPAGTYNVATPIILASYRGLRIEGEGYPVGATVGLCTYIRYTGTTGSLLTLNSCAAMEFKNIWFGYNSAIYNGDLVATNNPSGLDTTNILIDGCLFSGETAAAVLATSLLRLEKTINLQIEHSQFQYGQRGVVFYGYCNVITLRSCVFLQLGLLSTYAYTGANQSIGFYDSIFEPTLTGEVSAAFSTAPGVATLGFVFKGNWLGDVGTVGGLHWVKLDLAQGVSISENLFFTAGGGAADYAIYLTACSGVKISSNVFFDKAINFTNASNGVVVIGNSFTAMAGQIGGRGFVSKTSSWLSNTGLTGGGAPHSKATLVANQSVPNTTHTAISFASNIFDQGPVHSTSINPSRFTVPVGQGGLWELAATLTLASVACSYAIRILKNGAEVTSVISGQQSAAGTTQACVLSTDIAADGDYYEVTYWQNSGGALNVIGAATYAVDTHMSAYRVINGD